MTCSLLDVVAWYLRVVVQQYFQHVDELEMHVCACVLRDTAYAEVVLRGISLPYIVRSSDMYRSIDPTCISLEASSREADRIFPSCKAESHGEHRVRLHALNPFSALEHGYVIAWH